METLYATKFERIHAYVLVSLACVLSVTVLLKVGEIQYLELIFAADFFIVLGLFAKNGLRAWIFRPFFNIGASYAIFLLLALLLSLIALRQNFFLTFSTFLKQPLLVTISRMAEFFLDSFYALYIANLLREDSKLCRFGAQLYCWTGIAGCLYSFLTFPLNVLFDMQLGTYLDTHRFRGFNNEGGGFGLYLLSVCLLLIVMYRKHWVSRTQCYYRMAILTAGLIGSQSKSAFFAIGMLGLINLFFFWKGWKRWAYIAAVCAAVVIIGNLFHFQTALNAYVEESDQYQTLSNLRAEDGNVVMGRVAGMVLAPRMIAAHPLLGIGWGNYPLVRDDPQYRQGAAFSLGAVDSPSLGIIDYVVEFGIPLLLYFTWVELKPAFLLRWKGDDISLVNLALILPISTWAGAHLNLIHPWIVLALALGLSYQTDNINSVPLEISSAGLLQ